MFAPYGGPVTLLLAGAGVPPVLIAGGRIASVGTRAAADRVVDVTGLRVAPGFVDVQINGAFGIDLRSHPERLWELASLLPPAGVTTFLPTIPSAPPGVVERVRAELSRRPPDHRGADAPGLHLEGPMLNPAQAGAHDPDLLRPFDVEDLTGIALVTLAPELPGAEEVIARLRGAGVAVAAGHTEATDLGSVDGVTHLFNAMPPVHHRSPGPAVRALVDSRLWAGLICDGEHVDPLVVRLAERLLGERLVLVSDAVGGPTRRPDGGLAGGAALLDQAVRNLVAWTGCTPERAIAAASSAPARFARLGDRGAIRAGARADLVVLSPDLRVVATIAGGELVYTAL